MPTVDEQVITDPSAMSDAQREQMAALHQKVNDKIGGLYAEHAKQRDRVALRVEAARTAAVWLVPLVANVAATAMVRRLLRALGAAGVPVPQLQGRQLRRIVWPAMVLLRLVGAALRGVPRVPK